MRTRSRGADPELDPIPAPSPKRTRRGRKQQQRQQEQEQQEQNQEQEQVQQNQEQEQQQQQEQEPQQEPQQQLLQQQEQDPEQQLLQQPEQEPEQQPEQEPEQQQQDQEQQQKQHQQHQHEEQKQEQKQEQEQEEQQQQPQGVADPAAISWGVGLLRRRLCALPDTDDADANHLHLLATDFAPDACRQLTDLLTDTVLHRHNNSALLLGPRGCGKSFVLAHVLRDLRREHSDRFSVVRLNGLLHHDDRCAFKEIAKQLCTEHHLSFSNSASVDENRIFLSASLRDSALEQRAVVLVLDEFDLFAQRSQQFLLYNLLDAMQSPECQAAVVGLSSRLDADLLLEKRVRSRFSHRKLLLFPPTLEASLGHLLKSLLLPVRVDFPHTEFSAMFNLNTARVLEDKGVKLVLRRFFEMDLSYQQIFDLAFRIVSNMDRTVGFISTKDVVAASSALRCKPKMSCLEGLSVLELYLLVSMKRLERKERETYNFEAVFSEYEQLRAVHNTCDVYSRQLALRAFEHLLERELIAFSDSRGSSAKEFRPVKLIICTRELDECLRASTSCPTILLQWSSHETFK